MASLATIKSWFQTNFKPTQAQFWAVFDSFRHKDDKVPISQVEGIESIYQAINDIPNNYVTRYGEQYIVGPKSFFAKPKFENGFKIGTEDIGIMEYFIGGGFQFKELNEINFIIADGFFIGRNSWNNKTAVFDYSNIQQNVSYSYPNKSGTIAMLSDIPSSSGGAALAYKSYAVNLKVDYSYYASGTLEIGKRYRIEYIEAGDDFSNVGFVSDNVPFIATGTTPINWTHNTQVEEVVFLITPLSNEFIGTTFQFSVEDQDTGKVALTASTSVFTANKIAVPGVNFTRSSGNKIVLNKCIINNFMSNYSSEFLLEVRVYN